MNIKLILFDLGGILVPERGAYISGKISQRLGITQDKLSELVQPFKSSLLTGKISLFTMYKEVSKACNGIVAPEDLLKTHIEAYLETSTARDQGIIGLITNLKINYAVAGLTNTSLEIADLNKKSGLFDYFPKIYISTDMGFRKPQPESYQYVLDDLGYRPKQVVFIDNNEEYINGAKALGINTIHYVGLDNLKVSLQLFSVKLR